MPAVWSLVAVEGIFGPKGEEPLPAARLFFSGGKVLRAE